MLKKLKIEYLVVKSPYLAGDSPNKIMILFGMIANILPLIKFIKKKAKSTKTTNPTIELIPNIFDPFDAVVIETVIYPIPIFLSSLP